MFVVGFDVSTQKKNCFRKQDLNNKNEEKIEIEIKIETTSNPKQEDRKQLKACDEDSYIVKLFKSLMSPEGSQKNAENKKK